MQAGKQTGWLAGRQSGWLADWQAGRILIQFQLRQLEKFGLSAATIFPAFGDSLRPWAEAAAAKADDQGRIIQNFFHL
jgi:hypothetical protein